MAFSLHPHLRLVRTPSYLVWAPVQLAPTWARPFTSLSLSVDLPTAGWMGGWASAVRLQRSENKLAMDIV